MSGRLQGVSTTFFGFNRKLVETYVAENKSSSNKKIDEIQSDTKRMEAEKSALKEQLKELEEMVQLLSGRSADILFAKKRLEKTLTFLNDSIRHEIDEIDKNTKNRKKEYDDKIDLIKEDIENVKNSIAMLLENLKELLDNDPKVKQDVLTAKNNFKLIQYVAKSANTEETEEDDKEVRKESEADSDMPAEEEDASAEKEAAEAEQEEKKVAAKNDIVMEMSNRKMTADGSVATHGETAKRNVPERLQVVNIKQGDLLQGSLKTAIKEKRNDRDEIALGGDSFWDDEISNILNDDNEARDKKVIKPYQIARQNTNSGNAEITITDMPFFEQSNTGTEDVPIERSDIKIPDAVAEAKVKTPASSDTYKGKEMKSPAVSGEIKAIRYKYIVGKVAGENHYDSQNRLIIAKGSVITEEVVDRAEMEGRLSELIINMELPGLES